MDSLNLGLLYTGMGMLIVFAVLVILMVVICLMQLFGKKADAEKSAPAPAPADAIDANETIAVISATVAAMSGDDPNKRLRVKSIKDQSGNVLWSK